MNPEPEDKPPRRPAVRNRKGQRRTKKLEVKLTEPELRMIRKKFGRLAAAAARNFLLGFRVANPSTPDKAVAIESARALHSYHISVDKLRQRIKQHLGTEADALTAALMAAEEQLFQSLLNTWFSNFSKRPS